MEEPKQGSAPTKDTAPTIETRPSPPVAVLETTRTHDDDGVHGVKPSLVPSSEAGPETWTSSRPGIAIHWHEADNNARFLYNSDHNPAVSESDIELEYWPLPTAGVESTDDLLPIAPVSRPNSIDAPDPERNPQSIHDTETSRVPPGPPVEHPGIVGPNYKPIPLGWPYQAFLLVSIAGLFAFFEYQAHILPVPNYQALQLPSQPHSGDQIANKSTTETAPSYANAHKTQDPGIASSTTSTYSSSIHHTRPRITTPTQVIHVRAKQDARPPEKSYQQPASLTSCYWEPPVWWVHQRFCWFWLHEYYIISTSQDAPGFCPCNLEDYTVNHTTHQRLGSPDPGCRSVLNVLQAFSADAETRMTYYPLEEDNAKNTWYLTTFSYWPTNGPPTYWATPPNKPMPWIPPSMAANGDVFLPLELRTSSYGPDDDPVSDIFGNRLQPPFTGYFVPGHTGVETFVDNYAPSFYQTPKVLGTTQHPERSISWWKLPLTGPASVLASSTISSTSHSVSTAQPFASGFITFTTTGVVTGFIPPSITRSTTIFVENGGSTVSTTIRSDPDFSEWIKTLSTATWIAETWTVVETATSHFTGLNSSSIHGIPRLPEQGSTSTSMGTTSTSPPLASDATSDLAVDNSSTSSSSRASGTNISTIATPWVVASSGSHAQTNGWAVVVQAPASGSFITSTQSKLGMSSNSNDAKADESAATTRHTNVITSPGPTAMPTERPGGLPKDFTVERFTWVAMSGSPITTETELHAIYTTTVFDPQKNTPVMTITTHSKFPYPWGGGPVRTSGPFPPQESQFFDLSTERDYLMASLIPVLLATLLAVPLQIFTKTVNYMLPFRALSSAGPGSASRDSLCLSRSPSIFVGPGIGLRFLREARDPLPLLNVLLGMLSMLLIPLASEAIMIEFMDTPCGLIDWWADSRVTFSRCPRGLRKSVVPIRGVEACLVLMAAVVLAMSYLLLRWRTGLATAPWSIAALASLLADSPGLRDRLEQVVNKARTTTPLTKESIRVALQTDRFRLGYFDEQQVGQNNPSSWSSAMKYGIEVIRAAGPDDSDIGMAPVKKDGGELRPTTSDPPERSPLPPEKEKKQNKTRFGAWISSSNNVTQTIRHLGRWVASNNPKDRPRQQYSFVLLQGASLVLISGLLILVLYYENTILDTAFERFMDSQKYGVRFLFVCFGTAISSFWEYYFLKISEQQIYHRLYSSSFSGGLPAHQSILLSPPTTEFTAIWHSIRYYHRSAHGGSPSSSSSSSSSPPRNHYYYFYEDVIHPVTASLAAVFARFTPILLSGVPFRLTVTWKMHETFTWMLVGVLGYMVLVLFVSLAAAAATITPAATATPPNASTTAALVAATIAALNSSGKQEQQQKNEKKKKIYKIGRSKFSGSGSNGGSKKSHDEKVETQQQQPFFQLLPVSTDSIAGNMVYLCNSRDTMLRDFGGGLSTRPAKERDRLVSDMVRRYTFDFMFAAAGVEESDRGISADTSGNSTSCRTMAGGEATDSVNTSRLEAATGIMVVGYAR